MKKMPCFSCGTVTPDIQGPVHRYLDSSPGCWAMYGEVLEREYAIAERFKVHNFSVDAYAVQHPGKPSPQSIRSVALHLMSLCATIDRNMPSQLATTLLRQAGRREREYHWLIPPQSLGNVNVCSVRGTRTDKDHQHAAVAWAQSAWQAWTDHHSTIHKWLDRLPPIHG